MNTKKGCLEFADCRTIITMENWEEIHDFNTIIRQREINRIPFYHRSPQIKFRQILVDHIRKVCVDQRLTQKCLHLAIYVMDIFMDNHSIRSSKLPLVANVCLLIAAKFEEKSPTIPKISELNSTLKESFPIIDYKTIEIIILSFFDFYLMLPTPAQYIFYYMQYIISSNDLKEKQNFRTLFYNVNSAIHTYLDKIIYDVHFMQCYPPSKLAAAIIAASRKKASLKCWTEQLQKFTEYEETTLIEIMEMLLREDNLYCEYCKRNETVL